MLNDQYIEVTSISSVLDRHIQGTFDDLISDPNLTDQQKIHTLNEQLQPFVQNIIDAHPNVGAGYYVKELNSIVAFGPNFEEKGLIDLSPTSQAREVYITGESLEFHNYSQTRAAYVVANINPIIRNGEVIGHSWSNIAMDDLFSLFKDDIIEMLLVLAIMVIIALLGSRMISQQFHKALKRFKTYILSEEPPKNPQAFSNELLDVYNAFTESRSALAESEKRFRDVVNSFDEFVWEVNLDGKYTYISNRVEAILGYTPAELIGTYTYDLMPAADQLLTHQTLADSKNLKQGFSNLYYTKTAKDGRIVHLSSNSLILLNAEGEAIGLRGATRDISIQKEYEQSIQKLAYFDPLTGLPNRTSLHLDLKQLIDSETPFALLFIDLDHFKSVNDTLGHHIGDELLTLIAYRFRLNIQEHDRVYRFGGDEFIILMQDIDSMHQLESRTQELLYVISAPLTLNGQQHMTTMSVGISLFKEHATTPEELIRFADLAMYQSKERGKNQFSIFDQSLDVKASEHFEISHLLNEAIAENQFQLYYQPQICLKTGKVSGVEALARWIHPEKGFISPAKFIPVAEETGLIIQLGQQILLEACRTRKEWLEAGVEDIRVAVNISLKQFQQTNFINQVLAVLAQTELEGRYLELEITESIAMDSPALVIEKLQKFQEHNIFISIDDFGMGYSSLNYLKQLPIQQLKIDRAFVQDIDQPHDLAIIKSIVTMADVLKLEVIAEGVETIQQATILKDMNCQFAQGYLYHKPMPASDAFNVLTQVKTV